MRILITGSRGWTDENAIATATYEAWLGAGYPSDVTVIHGACPTGADYIAVRVAGRAGFALEAHRPDWSTGRRAGPDRNKAMVAAQADICLAFISECTSSRCKTGGIHSSHGATGCAQLAEDAGIPTARRYSRAANPGT